MKQVTVLLLSLFATSTNAMQPDATTSCNIQRIFKLKPATQLEINVDAKKISVIAREIKEPEPDLTTRLGAYMLGKTPTLEKLCTICILALMEITHRIETPYEVIEDEKGTHIRSRTDLKELGITLKELIVTLPNDVPLKIFNEESIDVKTDGSFIDAQADTIECQAWPNQTPCTSRLVFRGAVGNSTEILLKKFPDIILRSQGTISIRPTQKK